MPKTKLDKIMNILQKEYPHPETALEFETPFQLLIATILSAQTTDKQVNKVTKKLFEKYKCAQDFAEANPEKLAEEINSIGLYYNKSKYIIEASKIIKDKYQGEIPETRKDLMKLPGVGRKTANVVMGCAFSKNTIAVDTHVFRVANRLGLVESDKVLEVEQQLMDLIPEDKWLDMHHWLIFHGRNTCKARKPNCQECELKRFCKYYQYSKSS